MPHLLKSNDFATERAEMVYGQLLTRDIEDRRVLAAMSQVERERFVGRDVEDLAYGDFPLPLECGQTISQPYTVAIMAQAAKISSADRVLEIGTGSGYGAAVLSLIALEVHTVERIPHLANKASQLLHELRYNNAHVHEGDGTLGLPAYAPYNAIIVTAAARSLPEPYFDQLAYGGRLIIPIGSPPHAQSLCRFTLRDSELKCDDLGKFNFVPLIGEEVAEHGPALAQ